MYASAIITSNDLPLSTTVDVLSPTPLSANSSLFQVKELRLENCGLGDREGILLGEALAENTSLVLLDLCKNKINNEGGSALVPAAPCFMHCCCVHMMRFTVESVAGGSLFVFELC